MAEQVNPTQMDEVEILDTSARMFKSWGSVEVRDKENDLLPMSEFRKIMPVIMKRGGILMDRHSNRQVGKILNFEFKDKQTPEGLREGVMITGEIFKDYEHDDMVWQGIKDGVYKGLSFGGRNKIKDVKFDKSGLTNILKKLEGFEFSLVPGMGNQEATMERVNFLAKSNLKKAYEKDGAHVHAEDPIGLHNHPEIEKEMEVLRQELIRLDMTIFDMNNPEGAIELSKEDIKKPFAGYKDFDDCVSKNQDKNDPKAYCASIKQQVEKVEKQYSDGEKKKKELTEKSSSLSSVSKNSEKYINENDLNKGMEEAEIKKVNDQIEKNSSDIVEINKKLDLLVKQDEDEEDKEKKKQDEEEEDKEKKKQDEDKKPDEDNQEKKKEDDDEDKKPEEEVDKANGAEGEKKVQLPKVGEEETGGGEQAQGGEGEDVKFVEKSEFDEVKKKLDNLVNKSAQTPRPATGLISKALGGKAPKSQKDIIKMLQTRQ